MKKILLIFLLTLSLTLTGCDWLNTFETTTTTSNLTETGFSTTTLTTITNTDLEIDIQLNPGQDNIEINSSWIDASATIIINDEEYEMETLDFPDLSTIGLYPITYNYTYLEETYSLTRYVIVFDQSPPVISLNAGIDTVELNSEWIDTGVTIIDNSKELIEPQIENNVDVTTPGTYTVTYSATDSVGNTSTLTRYVTVIELEE